MTRTRVSPILKSKPKPPCFQNGKWQLQHQPPKPLTSLIMRYQRHELQNQKPSTQQRDSIASCTGPMGNSCIMALRDNKCRPDTNSLINPVIVSHHAVADRVLRDIVPLPLGRSASDVGVRDKYVIGAELGRGEFGIVCLCTDRETHDTLACKSIYKKKLRTAVDVEDVRREVGIMSVLPDHPNVVRMKAAYEDDEAVHIVMELCKGGELFYRIVARGHYSEHAAADVFRTISEVVRVCHTNGVIHRDLKPENFLYADNKDNSPLKAIDFGLSVFFRPGERFSEIVGSPYYMAPEVLKRNYGPEVDVWSAGVILYILLCGAPPFWAENEQGVAKKILDGVIDFNRSPWPQISQGAKDLVRGMLQIDPEKRSTIQQVLDHPWLQNAKRVIDGGNLGEIVRARLKQFSVMNRFKKKVMRVIADHLSVEEVEFIRKMFMTIDTDNNGKVTFEELKTGLQNTNSQLTESEMILLMEAADVDGNGFLDYGEFVAISIHLQRISIDEHLRRAFIFFDKDESGYVELDELADALADDSGYTDSEVLNVVMQEVDIDKDGRISYQEFLSMMKSGVDWRKASRQYSREVLRNLNIDIMKHGSRYAANHKNQKPWPLTSWLFVM